MEQSKLEKFVEELSALIRARYPLIFLESYEESRCLGVMTELAKKREASLYVWSRTQGIYKDGRPNLETTDPMAALKWYEEVSDKSIFVLKDFHPYLKDPGIIRKLRDLAQSLKRSHKNMVFLSPLAQIPPELNKEFALLDVPLPSRNEIRTLIHKASTVLPTPITGGSDEAEGLIDAACGLTFDEIENVLAKSIVLKGSLDKRLVQEEKKQIVRKTGLLEFMDISDDIPSVGGLEMLKEWLTLRRSGLSKEARDLGLPAPKGMMLVGIPGCGKSLLAMTIGREWQLPLIRLDMGKIFSGIVGSSEGNIRAAISTCEAVSPCVLWIDEIEKGLSGTQSSGQSDGGTTSRVFGTILTWMQEKKSPVFVVATANDISQLPPEFLRKGRFDEIFFVDLPAADERREILKIHLNRFGWEAENLDLNELTELSDGFSGSELEQVVISARYMAFGRTEIFSQKHLVDATVETIPLSKTMSDRIEGLRAWAKNRARLASTPKKTESADRFVRAGNAIEMEERRC